MVNVVHKTTAVACHSSSTQEREVPEAMSMAAVNWGGTASSPSRLAPGMPKRMR
ncbi:hypothetical protein [Micromonospora sp. NPDC050276]|uniref:hypothetical protein n=1 Tax=Micromonospora sp. NPDC050276 TaxID=3364278 RepID=UPI0037AD11D1